MSRVAILCPGRGSYGEPALGSLASHAGHTWIARADAMRAERGLEPLSALDGARRFEPARHLLPSNVSPLIWLVTMLDGAGVMERDEVVAIAGNSMGWYTALSLGGALSFDDGFRLVQEMSLLQERGAAGGQILYPVVDDDWRSSPERAAAVERALADTEGQAWPSIHLGGYEVLAGSEEGLARLTASLPKASVGKTGYPFRLAQHGPYHTPLAAGVAGAAREALAGLAFGRPRVTLVDGRGARSTPWSSDVTALRAYTFGTQVLEPYDFAKSVRVALREYAPDELVLPGPGNTLGGVVGTILVAERWRGIDSKHAFEAAQAGERPPVRSLRR